MTDKLSIPAVLDGVVESGDIEGLHNLVMQHKNWGAFTCRVPSYIIVNLIDTIRLLREHGARYYVTSEGRPSSLDDEEGPTPDELVPDADEEIEDAPWTDPAAA
jgi:hypothetical protein